MQCERAALHHPSSLPPNHIHNSLSHWLPASSRIPVRCCDSSQSTAAHPTPKSNKISGMNYLAVSATWQRFGMGSGAGIPVGKMNFCGHSTEKASSPPPLVTLVNLPHPQLMPRHSVHLYHFSAQNTAACSGKEQVLFPVLT